MSSYLQLEVYFDDQGVLCVRDKETKAVVSNDEVVSLSNDKEVLPY